MMDPDELLFALAPDARTVTAVRDVLARDGYTHLTRSSCGQWLSASYAGSLSYQVTARFVDATFRSYCDCDSMKYPCKHAVGLAVLALQGADAFQVGLPSPERQQHVLGMPLRELPKPAAAPTSVGEALLHAVFDDPDDRAAPLIYADWLSEQGTAEQQPLADFIRVQSRLQELPDDSPERAELAKEEQGLLKKHKSKWLAVVPAPMKRKVEFVGGFLRRVLAPASKLIPLGEELAAVCPITEVYLTGNLRTAQASQLAVMSWLRRVRLLSLGNCLEMDLAALELLLNSLYLRHLRALDLAGVGLSPRLLKSLAESSQLALLEHLSVVNNFIGDTAVRVILDGFPRLRRLEIDQGSLRPVTVRQLQARFGAGLALN